MGVNGKVITAGKTFNIQATRQTEEQAGGSKTEENFEFLLEENQ